MASADKAARQQQNRPRGYPDNALGAGAGAVDEPSPAQIGLNQHCGQAVEVKVGAGKSPPRPHNQAAGELLRKSPSSLITSHNNIPRAAGKAPQKR
ncbi:MAG: hypothetical protein U0401_19050 [Anaerolineae bacterium]